MVSSGESKDDRSVRVIGTAERVLPVDPTAVWSLVADPARTSEWAGVTTVGYMGTELPKTGQAIFVRLRRWDRDSKARRVEIESWEAGTGYRCVIASKRAQTPIRFDLTIKSEVVADGIATRVKLTQRMVTAPAWAGITQRYVAGRLERKLDRIERAAAT